MNATDPTTTIGGLRGLLEQLDALHGAGETGLLGIVVATEGSTYQKPGALVLLDRNGMRHGVISGGCLEPELERRAQVVHASGRAAVVEFDTRSDEDLVFGSGTGCRGRVHLLLLPQPRGAPLTDALRRCAQECVLVDVRLSLEGEAIGCGAARIVDEVGDIEQCWTWNSFGMSTTALPAGTNHSLRIKPPPRILLLGAGPETAPLLDLLQRLGWYSTVVEHRTRWLAFALAARADRIIQAAPVAAIEQLAGDRSVAAIVMSHNYVLDGQFLRYCALRPFGYIGLLGPPARRDALLTELGATAGDLRARLHAPVGLDLGGSGPEVIALAIAAELQQHLAQPRRA